MNLWQAPGTFDSLLAVRLCPPINGCQVRTHSAAAPPRLGPAICELHLCPSVAGFSSDFFCFYLIVLNRLSATMGNDGGSIARRDELVKVKVGKPVQEAARQRRARWSTCALSKKPLKQPVVADGLGRMYNKEALVNWLIQSKVNDAKGVKDEAGANMSHVRKLKVSSRDQTCDK